MKMFYCDQERILSQLETLIPLRLILGLLILVLMALPLLFPPTARFASAPQTVLFIDPAVADYQTLVEGVVSDAEVIILDPQRDGVEQIGQILQTKNNISSLHIVSHGSPGNVQLGSTQLNLANLNDYADRLQQWTAALAPGGDMLLYGCDVAANEHGLAFARRLGELTGADVAASINLTGAAALGGDWTFEFATGEIQADLAFAPATTSVYETVLTRPVLDTSGNPTLPPIDENEPEASNQGILLADLIAQAITDTDSGALEGIAVTGLSGNGTWQYSLDGVTWHSFGPVSVSQATVLKVLTPLYDGPAGGRPTSQGWLAKNIFTPAIETLNSDSTTLDSTGDVNLQDGYSSHIPDFVGGANKVNPAYPTLDLTAGYTIRFEVKINSEDHNDVDRAGFSIISISSDTAKGIELGFWQNEIWAQEDGIINNPPYLIFTHGTNSISYMTTATTTYDLAIQGSDYELFAAGASVLTGPLRDYGAWPDPGAPLFDVYETPSYLFLGDDTTSAKASFTLRRLEILEKTRIRFVPDQDFRGTATITYRAWDLTDGSSSGDSGVDTSGGAFSMASETAEITVGKTYLYLPLIIK